MDRVFKIRVADRGERLILKFQRRKFPSNRFGIAEVGTKQRERFGSQVAGARNSRQGFGLAQYSQSSVTSSSLRIGRINCSRY